MIQQIVLVLHIFLAIALIGLVLIQRGKGASMGAAFGSGASQTVFGSRGSLGFLVKLTVIIAALFFATSITLTYMASKTVKQPADNRLVSNVERIANKIADEKQIEVKAPIKGPKTP